VPPLLKNPKTAWVRWRWPGSVEKSPKNFLYSVKLVQSRTSPAASGTKVVTIA
jgi:hypothetical protein